MQTQQTPIQAEDEEDLSTPLEIPDKEGTGYTWYSSLALGMNGALLLTRLFVLYAGKEEEEVPVISLYILTCFFLTHNIHRCTKLIYVF